MDSELAERIYASGKGLDRSFGILSEHFVYQCVSILYTTSKDNLGNVQSNLICIPTTGSTHSITQFSLRTHGAISQEI